MVAKNDPTGPEKGFYYDEDSLRDDQVEINPITLIFSDPVEEREFRRKLHDKSKFFTRVSLIFLILTFFALYPYDRYMEDFSDQSIRWRDIVRAIQLPIAITWLLLTWLENFSHYYIFFTAAATTVIGFLSVGLSIAGTQPDHAPHMVYLFFAWLFVRLPYFAAVLVCWPVFLAYCIGVPLFVKNVDENVSTGHFRISATYLLLTNVALNLAAFFIERLDRKEFLHSKSIAKEDEVNQHLLANLLPPSVTRQLEKSVHGDSMGEPIAESKENVSVLFSDLVGFTKYSSSISARNLVNFLNDLYHRFDQLCDDVGAYKVETIGDAYFVSAGCPDDTPKHAQCLVQLGILMIKECQQIPLENGQHPNIRVGVHSGPVMAGVVGKKMPRYHLFGKTVTIAEKMESTGKPGRVQVSEATYNLIKDNYYCEEYQDAEEAGKTYLVSKEIDQFGNLIDITNISFTE